jgi:hypothetical protein
MVLFALAAACFARLLMHPLGLIVDANKPSIDHANLAGPRPVGNDLVGYVLPQYLSITRTLARYGHIPLWDTRGFAGRPFCGNPQSGLFYPPVWAAWWLDSPAAPGWLTVGHLVWGGIGTFWLSRFLGAGRCAATVAAGIYQASPFLLAHTFEGHYPHIWAAAWYPWAFWCFARWRAGETGGAVLLPLVLAMTYLTGHPQEWLLLILTLILWSIVDIVTNGRNRGVSAALRTALVGGGAFALSLGLVAVEIAPQWAVRPWLLHNRLAASGLPMPRRYDLGALNGLQLLSPTALGGPADYFGDDNYWETVFSIGFAPLVLAATAILCSAGRRRARSWLIVLGISVWFACGRTLGLYALAYSAIPGMSWFRVPARSLFLATLAAAVLAGIGIDILRQETVDRQAWRAYARRLGSLSLAVLVALLIFQAGSGSAPEWQRKTLVVQASRLPSQQAGRPHHNRPDHSADASGSRAGLAAQRVLHDPRFWLSAGGLAILIGIGCVVHGERWRRTAGALAGLLALVELGWAGYSLVQVAPAERFLGPDPIGATINQLTARAQHGAPIRIKARDTFYGDLEAIASGLEKTNINDVFQLDHPARLYEMLYQVTGRPRPHEASLPMREPVALFQRTVRQAIFDRMSVDYLISDRFEPDPGWPVVARGRAGSSCYAIARNPTVLPRAYVVPHAAVATEPPPFVLSLFRELDPRQSVVMDHDPLAELASESRQPFTVAQWVSLDPDRPRLRVTTQDPGLLVVADTWMPGWTARVDDQNARIFRGNVAQRVIPILGGGTHTIAMTYQPPGIVLGACVSALSMVVWLAIVGMRIQRTIRAKRAVDPFDVALAGPASQPPDGSG